MHRAPYDTHAGTVTCLGTVGCGACRALPPQPEVLTHLLVTVLIVRVILSFIYRCTSYSHHHFSLDTMSSSSTPTSNPGREQQMLAVGRQCSHPSCHLVDFLPFRCQHCADSFCADHFKPASHSCAKYDEAKYNRVAPDCEHCSCVFSYHLIRFSWCPGPLCNEPVPIPPGEDPNIRMERHLTIDCSVMTGRSQKASATPKCARPKCGKLLFAQIQCDVSFPYLKVAADRLTFPSYCRNAIRSSVQNTVSRVHTTASRLHRLRCLLPLAPKLNQAFRLL